MTETNSESDVARRVHDLRAFAAGVDVVPILVQQDPDPDGMASALGVRTLLHRSEHNAPIISLGEVTRAENQRMAELLDLQVVRVSEGELKAFRRVVAVDTQPAPADSRTRYAVIDHHPVRPGYSADIVDIRPGVGAAASMVTEYLRVNDEKRITPRLATALIYGIRTDTDVLRRGAAPLDVEAFAFLQGIADHDLLLRIGRPAFSEQSVRAMGRAMERLGKEGEIAVAYAGRLTAGTSHVLPNLADFCLTIEGVSWAAAAGVVEGDLVINIRRVGGAPGAGDLAQALAQEAGRGGGHRSMARVAIRLEGQAGIGGEPGDPETVRTLMGRISAGIEALRAPAGD